MSPFDSASLSAQEDAPDAKEEEPRDRLQRAQSSGDYAFYTPDEAYGASLNR